MTTRQCNGCKAVFTVGANERNPRKWCSESCRVRQYRRPRPARASRSRTRARSQAQVFTCIGCGETFRRPPTRGQRPKWCPACRPYHGRTIPATTRALVYERDGGICQICGDPCDFEAASTTDWAPTLDHVIPRADDGPDTPENLRLAHRWCNSVRAQLVDEPEAAV